MSLQNTSLALRYAALAEISTGYDLPDIMLHCGLLAKASLNFTNEKKDSLREVMDAGSKLFEGARRFSIMQTEEFFNRVIIQRESLTPDTQSGFHGYYGLCVGLSVRLKEMSCAMEPKNFAPHLAASSLMFMEWALGLSSISEKKKFYDVCLACESPFGLHREDQVETRENVHPYHRGKILGYVGADIYLFLEDGGNTIKAIGGQFLKRVDIQKEDHIRNIDLQIEQLQKAKQRILDGEKQP